MPAAKTQIGPNGSRFTEQFSAMESERIALGDTNDCAVKALAVATGADYKTVHALVASLGRKPRRGTNWSIIDDALRALGFERVYVAAVHFIHQYPGTHWNLRSVTSHHPERFPEVWRDGKTYLFDFGDHVAAVVNGVNHDWTKGRARRARRVFSIVPKTN